MLVREWKNALAFQFRIRTDGLLLALLYAVACWAARKISLDQLYLPAGIRVAALLVCPPRLAYFAQLRYPMIEKYGLSWAILASVYQMPTLAIMVYLHRRLMATRPDLWLLSIAALASIVIGVTNVGLMHLLWPDASVDASIAYAGRLILGDYIAILTVAPLAILCAGHRTRPGWWSWLQMPTIASVSALGVMGLLSAQLSSAEDSMKSSTQLLMVGPVIALSCIHGWRGAAVGVPMLSLIIHFTTPSTGLPGSFDLPTFKIQQTLAVVATALLALGSIVSHYRHRFKAVEHDTMQSLHLARSSHIASEMDLRARALQMRQIGERIDESLSQMAMWLKEQGHRQLASGLLSVSTMSSRQFREQTSMVYPTALEHVGLYLALQVGGISQEWDNTHRVSLPHLKGDPCRLSMGLQLATYRTLTEAVSLLLEHEPGQVQVRARCGRHQHMQGIVVTVAMLDTTHHLHKATREMAITRLTARTHSYGGRLQCRRNRIRMLLMETPGALPAGGPPNEVAPRPAWMRRIA